MAHEHEVLSPEEIAVLIKKAIGPRIRAATSLHLAQQVFQQQADATKTQASAVSGTAYTVLDTTKNVRIISMAALDNWSADTTTLQLHVTIDGQTWTFTVDPADNTWYSAMQINASLAATAQVLSATLTNVYPFLLEGRSVKVTVESTGGTSDSLQAIVKYAKIP